MVQWEFQEELKWNLDTKYNRLFDFVYNLSLSQRIHIFHEKKKSFIGNQYLSMDRVHIDY